MCVYTTCMTVPAYRGQKRASIPWSWSYRWLCAAPSAAGALNHRALSPAPIRAVPLVSWMSSLRCLSGIPDINMGSLFLSIFPPPCQRERSRTSLSTSASFRLSPITTSFCPHPPSFLSQSWLLAFYNWRLSYSWGPVSTGLAYNCACGHFLDC